MMKCKISNFEYHIIHDTTASYYSIDKSKQSVLRTARTMPFGCILKKIAWPQSDDIHTIHHFIHFLFLFRIDLFCRNCVVETRNCTTHHTTNWISLASMKSVMTTVKARMNGWDVFVLLNMLIKRCYVFLIYCIRKYFISVLKIRNKLC